MRLHSRLACMIILSESILFVFLPPPPSVNLACLKLRKEKEGEDTPTVDVYSEVHTLQHADTHADVEAFVLHDISALMGEGVQDGEDP